MKKCILVIAAVLMLLALFSCVTITDPDDTTNSTDNLSNMPDEVTLPTTTESISEKYFDLAEKAFNDADFPKMLDILKELAEKNSDTDINTFISEKIKSLDVISAPDLINAYLENELKAEKAYQGKLILVQGNIDSLGKDILDDVYISLSDGEKYSLNSVRCTITDEEEIDKAAELSKGDEIYIVGVVDDYLMLSVNLEKCYIVTNYMK